MSISAQIKQASSWEQRYRLLIQAGKNLPQPSAEQLSSWTEIHGCEAKLFCKTHLDLHRTFQLEAYSEARIMNGLLFLLMQEVNGKPAESLREFDIQQFFTALGIAQRLSASRLNGLQQIGALIRAAG